MKPLVERRSLSEEAAERIRGEILRGGFRQGERLAEPRIARELGISRGPIREAFRVLEAEGLLRTEPRRGTFVVQLSIADIREVFEVRTAIETRSARLVIRASSRSDLRELRGHVERLGEAARLGAFSRVPDIDLAFHETLCRVSGVRQFHEIFLGRVTTLQALVEIDGRFYASLDDIAAEHECLITALESGQEDSGAAAIEGHLETSCERVVAYATSRGLGG